MIEIFCRDLKGVVGLSCVARVGFSDCCTKKKQRRREGKMIIHRTLFSLCVCSTLRSLSIFVSLLYPHTVSLCSLSLTLRFISSCGYYSVVVLLVVVLGSSTRSSTKVLGRSLIKIASSRIFGVGMDRVCILTTKKASVSPNAFQET